VTAIRIAGTSGIAGVQGPPGRLGVRHFMPFGQRPLFPLRQSRLVRPLCADRLLRNGRRRRRSPGGAPLVRKTRAALNGGRSIPRDPRCKGRLWLHGNRCWPARRESQGRGGSAGCDGRSRAGPWPLITPRSLVPP
jgi:hypothetical protein